MKYLLIFICLFVLTGCSSINQTKQTQNSPQPSSSSSYSTTSLAYSSTLQPIETELSTFSTEILTDDDNRNNNISITCSKLNEHIVKSGETFSFTDTVGKATEEKGYEEANVFDKNGNTIKGLGGGNCQVSSTLYNAVLETENLEIIERHEHNQKVYYVDEGKDAAVSYGSVDFRFKNNNSYDIKIYAESSPEEVKITLKKYEV